MHKLAFLLIILLSNIHAKSYTLYLASTNSFELAKKYYENIKFHTPNFYDVIVRTHVKKNYSVIIRKIPSIEKAKTIQKLFLAQNKFNDSYIKRFEDEPIYDIVKIKDRLTLILPKEKLFKQNIEDTNEYITASTMYNTKQYQKAYDIFYKLFLKNNYNLNINYFLAKSAFNLKKYDEATAAFERVLIQKPDFNQARYDFAKILYILKQKEQAKIEFEKLLKVDINEDTKKEIRKYIQVLNKKAKRINGSLNIMFGLSRSSNVNNGLISPEYRLPGLNDIMVEGEEPIADTAHFEAVNLNLFNYIKSKPIRIKNSFLVYNKNYFNEKDQNITVFSYKPSVSYLNKESIYTFELAVDKIDKKTDEDFYAFSISPKYSTKDFSSFLKYQRIMYIKDENEEKDFEKIQFFTKINLFKNINFYTNIYKNQRIVDDRTDIDKYTIGNGINIFYDTTPKNRINLNYQFDYSKYKYENFAFDNKRKDENHQIALSLKHIVNKSNIINISTSYTKNNSNQDAYVYHEKAIQINYLKALRW